MISLHVDPCRTSKGFGSASVDPQRTAKGGRSKLTTIYKGMEEQSKDSYLALAAA
ncbi:unnamed protein product [Dovyalis caffra]|uniref:Uncharacterized protein n=1 Tax=Dovyalis caffra TaxID=77055 RepID=A0AAV1RVL0_9ROSI|nr:unnamed protein product [Dovyalis caffra]